MNSPIGISFRSIPTLFVSKVPSGDAGAATDDSDGVVGDGVVGDGVVGDGDDSPQPARNQVITRQVSHKLDPCRIEISLLKDGAPVTVDGPSLRPEPHTSNCAG